MVAKTPNVNDNQNNSFINDGNGDVARNVVVNNGNDNPIPVDFAPIGEIKSQYGESTSVAGLGSSTLIDKTIGTDLGTNLLVLSCSGDNKAYFTVEINSQVKRKLRTWFTQYNVSVDLSGEKLVDGDNVKIIVENKSNSTADFNATLAYEEYSL